MQNNDHMCSELIRVPIDLQVQDNVALDSHSTKAAFWQAQSPDAIFRAAWEMVELASKLKGTNPDELRLQRSVVVIKPIRG